MGRETKPGWAWYRTLRVVTKDKRGIAPAADEILRHGHKEIARRWNRMYDRVERKLSKRHEYLARKTFVLTRQRERRKRLTDSLEVRNRLPVLQVIRSMKPLRFHRSKGVPTGRFKHIIKTSMIRLQTIENRFQSAPIHSRGLWPQMAWASSHGLSGSSRRAKNLRRINARARWFAIHQRDGGKEEGFPNADLDSARGTYFGGV